MNKDQINSQKNLYYELGGFKGNTFQDNINSINRLYFGQGLKISELPFLFKNDKDNNYYLSAYKIKIIPKESEASKTIYYPANFVNPVFYYDNFIFFISSNYTLIGFKIEKNLFKRYDFPQIIQKDKDKDNNATNNEARENQENTNENAIKKSNSNIEAKKNENNLFEEKKEENPRTSQMKNGSNNIQLTQNEKDNIIKKKAEKSVFQIKKIEESAYKEKKPNDRNKTQANQSKKNIIEPKELKDKSTIQKKPKLKIIIQKKPKLKIIIQNEQKQKNTIKEEPKLKNIIKEEQIEKNIIKEEPKEKNIIQNEANDKRIIQKEPKKSKKKKIFHEKSKDIQNEIPEILSKLEKIGKDNDLRFTYETLCDILKNNLKVELNKHSPKLKGKEQYEIKLDESEFTLTFEFISEEVDSVGTIRDQIKLNEGEMSLQNGIKNLEEFVNIRKNKDQKVIDKYINNDFHCPILLKNFPDKEIEKNQVVLCEIKSGFSLGDLENQIKKRIDIIKRCMFNGEEKPQYYLGIVNLLSNNIEKLKQLSIKEPLFDDKVIIITTIDYKYLDIEASYEINRDYLLYKKIDKLESMINITQNGINALLNNVNEMKSMYSNLFNKIKIYHPDIENETDYNNCNQTNDSN